MAKRSASYGKELSKCKEKFWKYRELICNGTLLAIDPSCVSSSSMPGYAIYRGGKFIEGGILNIKYHPDLFRRLSRIRHTMQTEFSDIDVMIIEKIPVKPLFNRKQAADSGRIWLNAAAHSSLMQAVGVFKGSLSEDIPVIDIAAGVWTHEAKVRGLKEVKADDEDAIAIGAVAIEMTRDLIAGQGA